MKTIELNSTPDEQAVAVAVKVLQAGGLVIFPTETTYGAGVDATNPEAVEKLLAYKSRREGKPLSIAVTDLKMAARYVELNDQAKNIYDKFLPGPITVVCRGLGKVAPGVESEFGTLGLRVPNYELVLKIVEKLGKPMTATSANASGGRRPYTIKHIFDYLSKKQQSLIDLVLDAGELPANPPSTVIDTTLSTPTTLRQGEINFEANSELMSASEAETQKIAQTLMLKHWNKIKERGLVVGLDGKLGVGKTIFAQGVAKFLQIGDEVTSPTYNYLEEYAYERHGVSGMFYHLDLWKVESETELAELRVDELVKPNNILVIEWVDKFKDILTNQIDVKILITDEGENRKLRIKDD